MASKSNGTTASSQFVLRRATTEDVTAIQHMVYKAMGSSYLHSLVYPKEKAHLTSPEALFNWRVARMKKQMQAEDRLDYIVVPLDEPDKVAGAATWFEPGHFKHAKDLAETIIPASDDTAGEPTSNEQPEDKLDDPPASMDADVLREHMAVLDIERKEIWGDDANFWYLAGLSVDPAYQRKGLATMLVNEVLARADEEGVPSYLESTPEGAMLYPKLGFEKIKEYVFYDGKFVGQFFIRPAKKNGL